MIHRIAPALLAGLCLSAHAVQISLNPSRDITLFETLDGSLSSAKGSLFAGLTANGPKHRALMAFDLSSIPAGATVNSAQLTVNVTKAGFGGASLFSLYPLLQDWGEGTSDSGVSGGGAAATTGDATWLHTFYNSGTWTSSGGDFSATASASTSMGAAGSFAFSGASLAAVVQGWVAAPATNFGWILKNDETVFASSLRLDSREALTIATRPTLTIDYTLPSAASNWTGDSDGAWEDSGRWSAGVPNSAGAEAVFGPVISVSRNVQVAAPKTVGTLTIGSAPAYVFTGTATLTLDASGSNVYLSVLQGSHDIQPPLATAAGKELRKTGAGSVQVRLASIDALSVEAGMISLAANSGVTQIKTLTLAGGTLDVKDNTLRLDDGVASPRDSVRAALAAGSLTSSSLAVNFALGYLQPNTTQVDVLPLLAGDTDGNGKVNTLDFNSLAGHFGSSDAYWMDGDFNFDSHVTSTDFDTLVGNYGKSAESAPLPGSTVPEPVSGGVAFVIVITLSRRRQA